MRNKRIMRIVCLFMAALILVSSIVIVVSADTNGSGSASIEDFKTQMSTISYDDYMDMYPDYFDTLKTGDETLVFFDDARYSLSDESSVSTLKDRLGLRAGAEPSRTFLLLADRRVPSGDVLRLVGLARESGLAHVQIAERRE